MISAGGDEFEQLFVVSNDTPSDVPSPRPVRRWIDFDLRPEVRRGDGYEFLAEVHTGLGKDFQVSRDDYDAAVSAMTEDGAAGLKFDNLVGRFRALGGGDEQYRLRVVLRFWRLGKPPLVTRECARYRLLLNTPDFIGAASARFNASA
jgi:hypothetical protein